MTRSVRLLGRTGIEISPLCLGTATMGVDTDRKQSFEIFDAAIDGGINFFDSADTYTDGLAEEILGSWIAERGTRDDIVLMSKAGFRSGPGPADFGFTRLHLIRACEATLRRLNTDHIDLYLLHRPPPVQVAHDEALRALDDLVHSGKVRHVGSSTYPAWMIVEALALADRHHLTPFVAEQSPYNILDRRVESELVPVCLRYGLALMPWSPLGAGILAGEYQTSGEPHPSSRAGRYESMAERLTAESRVVVDAIEHLAHDVGLSPAQLSLLWVKDQEGVTAPTIGPVTVEQCREQLKVKDMSMADLGREVVGRIDQLVAPGTFVSDFFNTSGWKRATNGSWQVSSRIPPRN